MNVEQLLAAVDKERLEIRRDAFGYGELLRAESADYIRNVMSMYTERAYDPIMILGHGRSGKDTCGKFFSRVARVRYSGSTSAVVAPIIALRLRAEVDFAFEHRHLSRDYWFEACNCLRIGHPELIPTMGLANSDMLIGLRNHSELEWSLKNIPFQACLWIQKDVPADPTMEYDFYQYKAFARKYNHNFIEIENTGNYYKLYKQLLHVAEVLDLPFNDEMLMENLDDSRQAGVA